MFKPFEHIHRIPGDSNADIGAVGSCDLVLTSKHI